MIEITGMRNLILLFAMSVLTGCASIGADAMKLMIPEDLAILETLRGYSSQTTEGDIVEDFGAAIKGAGSARPVWEIGRENRTTRLYAYYLTGRLNKIHLLSLKPAWGYVIHYHADGTHTELK